MGVGDCVQLSGEMLWHVLRWFSQTAWHQLHFRAQAIWAVDSGVSCRSGGLGHSAASLCAAKVSTGAWLARPRAFQSMLVRRSAGQLPVMAAAAAVKR